jgi:hypothetical protein
MAQEGCEIFSGGRRGLRQQLRDGEVSEMAEFHWGSD